MKELIIKEECRIIIPDIHMEITYDGNKVNLVLTGDTDLMCDGDLNIGSTGELSLISKKDIHIDAVDSKIYLNSGTSKPVRDIKCQE